MLDSKEKLSLSYEYVYYELYDIITNIFYENTLQDI